MTGEQPPKQPRPSYEEGEPRDPKVDEMVRERGVERTAFVAFVHKVAQPEQNPPTSR